MFYIGELKEDVMVRIMFHTKIIEADELNVCGTALKNLRMICMKVI